MYTRRLQRYCNHDRYNELVTIIVTTACCRRHDPPHVRDARSAPYTPGTPAAVYPPALATVRPYTRLYEDARRPARPAALDPAAMDPPGVLPCIRFSVTIYI